MKRSGPPARKTRMSGGDPEKMRAWRQRSTATAQENARAAASAASRAPAPSKARTPIGRAPKREKAPIAPERRIEVPKPPKPREGPLTPAAWREAVWERDHGECQVCATEVPLDGDLWVWNAHHPLEKRILRAEGLFGSVWDPRNGIVLCRRDHDRHHSPNWAMPAHLLPRRVIEFATEIAPWGLDRLYSFHPITTTTPNDEGGPHGPD